MELIRMFLSWGVGQRCLGQTAYVLFPKFLELRTPLGFTAGVEHLEGGKRTAIFGGDGVDSRVDTVEEVAGARVRSLVANMNILVFEDACLGSKFRAQLAQGITALTDP